VPLRGKGLRSERENRDARHRPQRVTTRENMSALIERARKKELEGLKIWVVFADNGLETLLYIASAKPF